MQLKGSLRDSGSTYFWIGWNISFQTDFAVVGKRTVT